MKKQKYLKKEEPLENAQGIERFLSHFLNIAKLTMKEEGITIVEWSRRSGLSRNSIHQYLNGEQVPRLGQLVALGEALGLSMTLYMSRNGKNGAKVVPLVGQKPKQVSKRSDPTSPGARLSRKRRAS